MDAALLFHALLALGVIIVTARLAGALFTRIGQPAVMGEIVGGVLLGPSALGAFWPAAYSTLLPPSIGSFLGLYAQIGIILYMFLVGLEFDPAVVRKSGYATLAISHAGIVVPFALGVALAFRLHPALAASAAPFGVFALFLGVSMSITAFPVLARILADRGLSRTPIGTIALACAAVDDATAWCLLALVVGTAQAQVSAALLTAVLALGFVAAMVWGVGPSMRRFAADLERDHVLSPAALGAMLVGVFASASATEWIGIHALFGAFLFGAVVPARSRVAAAVHERLHLVVTVIFLPAFFAYTGTRTEIGLISGLDDWIVCAMIILVACAGKFGGSAAAARLVGFTWRDSAALGLLMNTRGLVELIVLNIGLDLRILSPRLFTMLVVMALVTTFMTTPLLQTLLKRHPWQVVARNARA